MEIKDKVKMGEKKQSHTEKRIILSDKAQPFAACRWWTTWQCSDQQLSIIVKKYKDFSVSSWELLRFTHTRKQKLCLKLSIKTLYMQSSSSTEKDPYFELNSYHWKLFEPHLA